MDDIAVLASIEAKTGQEEAVAALLASVQAEAGGACRAYQLGPSTFGLFATFADEGGCRAFTETGIGRMLLERTPELFAVPPRFDRARLLGT
jgi:hypothetical protein